MFILTDERLYWWPINIDVPDPNHSGKWQRQSFEMEFGQVDEDEAKAMAKALAEMPTAEERLAHQHDMLLKAARNWRGVVDAFRAEVPFSTETLRRALQQSWFNEGVYRDWNRSLAKGEARKGN